MNWLDILLLILIVIAVWGLIAKILIRLKWKDTNEENLPALINFGNSWFWTAVVIIVIRSFIFEPFRIPSGSMLPTLEIGDMVVVNRFSYGLRMPLTNQVIVPLGSPERGDVVVFRNPMRHDEIYIKRVIALPGDRVDYLNRRLFINGQLQSLDKVGAYLEADQQGGHPTIYREQLGEVAHDVLLMPKAARFDWHMSYPYEQNCQYAGEDFSCVVPEGHYFMMGDNRDNSADSRWWGFLPDELLLGRASFIILNLDGKFGRIGVLH